MKKVKGIMQFSPKKAVIPAAGIGTRLLPATKSQPKEMLPVGRKPVIQYVVEEVRAAGINQVLIITNQQKRAIEDHFDYDPHLLSFLSQTGKSTQDVESIGEDIEFFYVRQSNPKGLADAIGKAEAFVNNEPFVVCLGDSIIESSSSGGMLKKLINTYQTEEANVSILFEEVDPEAVVKYGIAKPRGRIGTVFEIDDLIEKPAIEQAPSNLAIAARYVFSPKIFEFIKKTKSGRNNEIQITDSIRLMLAQGHRGFGICLDSDEKRYDIGNYKSYFEAFFRFSLKDPEFGHEFSKYVKSQL